MPEDVFEIAFADSKRWFLSSMRESPFLSNFEAIDPLCSLPIASRRADAPFLFL
jgi:hypothetical protein